MGDKLEQMRRHPCSPIPSSIFFRRPHTFPLIPFTKRKSRYGELGNIENVHEYPKIRVPRRLAHGLLPSPCSLPPSPNLKNACNKVHPPRTNPVQHSSHPRSAAPCSALDKSGGMGRSDTAIRNRSERAMGRPSRLRPSGSETALGQPSSARGRWRTSGCCRTSDTSARPVKMGGGGVWQ